MVVAIYTSKVSKRVAYRDMKNAGMLGIVDTLILLGIATLVKNTGTSLLPRSIILRA